MPQEDESNEGAPGRLSFVLLGLLFVAAAVSVWFMYSSVPGGTTPFASHRSATMVTGVPAPLHAFPVPIEVRIRFDRGFEAVHVTCFETVTNTLRDALERGAPGSLAPDHDRFHANLFMSSIPPPGDWHYGYFGYFDHLDDAQREAILKDVAMALEIQLVTREFEDLQAIEVQFNSAGGTAPQRWRIERDAADNEVLVVSPIGQ